MVGFLRGFGLQAEVLTQGGPEATPTRVSSRTASSLLPNLSKAQWRDLDRRGRS